MQISKGKSSTHFQCHIKESIKINFWTISSPIFFCLKKLAEKWGRQPTNFTSVKISDYIFNIFLPPQYLYWGFRSMCPLYASEIAWSSFNHPSTASISSPVSSYCMSSTGLCWILKKADACKNNYHTGGGVQYEVKSSVYETLDEGHQSLQQWKWKQGVIPTEDEPNNKVTTLSNVRVRSGTQI